MTDDPQIIAWIPKTGDDTKPGESFAVFAQQTPRGRYYFLALDGDILVTLNSSYAAYMAGSVRADIAKNSDVDPEDFADPIKYEDSRIIIRSGFDESGDQVFSVDTRGHLPYVYALGLLEAAKEAISETYTDTEEEEDNE